MRQKLQRTYLYRKQVLSIFDELVTRERAQSFLTEEHIAHIVESYKAFKDGPGLARVATIDEVRAQSSSLSIPLYVGPLAPDSSSNHIAPTRGLRFPLAKIFVAGTY